MLVPAGIVGAIGPTGGAVVIDAASGPVSWHVVTDSADLRLHDTATGAVRDFVPLRPGHVSIYLCGATVQGLPHIGHVRSGVAFDILRRWLSARGCDVAFIRNVTDIDDKILNKAAAADRPWWEWAATYERAFSAAYDALGVLPPSAEPRATGHITQMVELIDRLIESGNAYAGCGDVYFDVLSYPEYGQLSGHRIDDVHQGEGVATGKRDQRDFTLWKGAKPGEPSWPTPWGRGRPGWHTECVGDGPRRISGAEFDIHCGGMDLIFPHHENEIAQSRRGRRQVRPLLAAQRLGHHGRREDEQVAGQRARRSRRCCSGCAPPSCGTTWAAPTTARCWNSPRPRCRTRSTPMSASRSSCIGCAPGSAPWSPGEWTPRFAAALNDDLAVPTRWPRCTAPARRATARSTPATTTPHWPTPPRSGR